MREVLDRLLLAACVPSPTAPTAATPPPTDRRALVQQLAQIHALFEFDLSGCFITNQHEVPYSYGVAIDRMVTLLVSHPAGSELSPAERVAIFREVTGFEVALFAGPVDAVLVVYLGNRSCPLGSHHYPGSRLAVVDQAGNFWPIDPNKPAQLAGSNGSRIAGWSWSITS